MKVSDGFRDLLGGMSSGLVPSLIRPNQAALLANVTARGGLTTNRPAFKPVMRNGQIVTVGGDAVVQCMEKYVPINGDLPNLFALVGGHIYMIGLDGQVTDQTLAGDPNSANLPQAWMKQGEQYFFVQDGQLRPLIYDGSTWRRAGKFEPPNWEMPVGTAMEYAFGRMLVAQGRTWVAGDIRGGPTEIYQFTENSFLAEGGSWTVPIPGLITAIKVMTALDNSIGQGPLTIHTINGIVTARIDQPRSAWKDIQFQQVANQQFGSVSQLACVIINGDLWFRSTDGWRSLILARRDFGTWGNVPQSFEMTSVVVFDDDKFLRYAQAVLFQNRLIGTSWPTPYKVGAYHRAFTAMDFAALGSLSNQIPPAWDGLWTGINPTAMTQVVVNNKERAFILARNTNTSRNELWEIVEGEPFDNTDGRIVWNIETASYLFPQIAQNGVPPDRQLKKLYGGEMYIEDIKGQVDFVVQFRSDQYPCWLDWCRFSLCNQYRNCDNSATCGIPQPYQPGFKSPVRLPQPPDTCQQGSTQPAREGMQFQARVTVTGHCKISKFFLLAETIETNMYSPNLACDSPATAPDAPSELEAEAVSFSDIELNWTDNSGGTAMFILQRRLDHTGDWETIATLPNGTTTYTDPDRLPDTEYCYRVIATNVDGTSLPSPEICVTTPSGDTLINIDFTSLNPTTKIGLAATGVAIFDFWNTWRIANGTTPMVLKYVNGDNSPASIASDTVSGMVATTNTNSDTMIGHVIESQSGPKQFTHTISDLPAGTYSLYLYGYGTSPGNDGFGTPNAAGLWEVLVNGAAYPDIGNAFLLIYTNPNPPPYTRAVPAGYVGNFAQMDGIVITAGQTLGIVSVFEGGTRYGRISGLQLVKTA